MKEYIQQLKDIANNMQFIDCEKCLLKDKCSKFEEMWDGNNICDVLHYIENTISESKVLEE